MRTVGIGHDGCDGYLIIELEPEGMEKIIYEAMPAMKSASLLDGRDCVGVGWQ